MPPIFLSHSSKDRQFADDLGELLRLHYLESWYSNRDIVAGAWEPEICKGLDRAKQEVMAPAVFDHKT
jgi:TIR domain